MKWNMLQRHHALIAVLLLPAFSGRGAETNRVNGIAATVNDSVITVQEVYRAVETELPRLRIQYATNPAKLREELGKLETAFLDRLVERQLVLSDYKDSGFNIPESFIDDQLKEEISRYGDRVGFIKTLQAQGKTVEEFRREFREALIYNIMSAQKVRNQITISPFKIERYYDANQEKFKVGDQVKLRLIELRKSAEEDPAAVARATEIHRQLAEGASFDELARQHSTGTSAREGGLVGMVSLDEMNEYIRAGAKDLKAGEFSGLIEAPSAIWIAKVEEVKPAHVKPLSEVRDQIEKDLQTEETVRRKQLWIDSIRAKAYIRTF